MNLSGKWPYCCSDISPILKRYLDEIKEINSVDTLKLFEDACTCIAQLHHWRIAVAQRKNIFKRANYIQ